MTAEGWLIDKSAAERVPDAENADEWFSRAERGLIRITTATLLEIGYSAQSAELWDTVLNAPPYSLMPVENARPATERRALEVQGMLARRGHHRAPSPVDLMLAAIAEDAGLTILHFDKDFELIAAVTGQAHERLAVAS